jgi:hypothetical protein
VELRRGELSEAGTEYRSLLRLDPNFVVISFARLQQCNISITHLILRLRWRVHLCLYLIIQDGPRGPTSGDPRWRSSSIDCVPHPRARRFVQPSLAARSLESCGSPKGCEMMRSRGGSHFSTFVLGRGTAGATRLPRTTALHRRVDRRFRHQAILRPRAPSLTDGSKRVPPLLKRDSALMERSTTP